MVMEKKVISKNLHLSRNSMSKWQTGTAEDRGKGIQHLQLRLLKIRLNMETLTSFLDLLQKLSVSGLCASIS